MSTLTDFAAGVAQILATESIGTWNPTGVYTADQVAITIAAKPETPAELITITVYDVSSEIELNDSVIGIQFWLRGERDPRSVMNRADAIFNVFEGLRETTVNGVSLVLMNQQSSAYLGRDQNDRHIHASTFFAQIARPTRYRTD